MTSRKPASVPAVAEAIKHAAAGERDMAIELINQRFDAIRSGLDAERADILTSLDGIDAALKAIEPKPSNVVALAAE